MLAKVSDEWRPFGLDADEEHDYAVLVPGVPTWLRQPIVQWLLSILTQNGWARQDVCLQVQTVTRVDLRIFAGTLTRDIALRTLLSRLSEPELLRVVDYVLDRASLSSRQALVNTLEEARSKWTVGDREARPGLVERVPAGVQDAAEATISSSGAAGRLLARAWANAYGIEPSPSHAYQDAVKAVEVAASASVEPHNAKATLGTSIGQMGNDGDWRLPLRELEKTNSQEMVLLLMRSLWDGHRDRHGSADYSDVTLREARAAVTLAVSLVDWFVSGAIARQADA